MGNKFETLLENGDGNMRQQILEVIRKNVDKRKAKSIELTTEFSNDGIDSIEYIDVAVKLEQVFGFQFEDKELVFGNFKDVLSMAEYIESRIARLTEIQQGIYEIITKCTAEGAIEDIDYYTDFTSAGIDSVKFIEIALQIEEAFSFTFEDEKLVFGALNNINDIAKYIELASLKSAYE